MERKLASIQRVVRVEPIDDADSIEKITVLGWHLVSKKGEFKEGDLCVYFETDSLLPMIDVFSFLSNKGTKSVIINDVKHEGYLLKTAKLRGVISQGLALKPELFGDKLVSFKEGDDVTETLGIVKYEKPLPKELVGVAEGDFPTHLFPKTYADRIQTVRGIDKIERRFYATEKLDGTSFTMYVYNGEFGMCSRNLKLKEDNGSVYAKIGAIYKNKLIGLGRNIAVQGEIVGEGIQGNKYGIDGVRFYVFSVYDIDKQMSYGYAKICALCDEIGCKMVPLTETKTQKAMCIKGNIDDIINDASGNSVLGNVLREGIVFKFYGDCDISDNIVIKAISPEWLLKYE